MATALLFERDSVDELDDWSQLPRLGRSTVPPSLWLWIDLDSPDEAEVGRLAEVFDLHEETRASLLEPPEEPALHVGRLRRALTSHREVVLAFWAVLAAMVAVAVVTLAVASRETLDLRSVTTI